MTLSIKNFRYLINAEIAKYNLEWVLSSQVNPKLVPSQLNYLESPWQCCEYHLTILSSHSSALNLYWDKTYKHKNIKKLYQRFFPGHIILKENDKKIHIMFYYYLYLNSKFLLTLFLIKNDIKKTTK